MHWKLCGAAVLSCVALLGGVWGAEAPPVQLGPDGLPVFKHPYQDGLYSTVTAMNMFWAPEVEQQKKLKLKVPGFRKELPALAVMQTHKAPLVVVLLGLDGKVNGPWGGLFPYWYYKAGSHVLTFDSSFTPAYGELCGQGVVGNFEAEAGQIAAIINAYLQLPEMKDKVTRVGVVGMSFGAIQALLLAARGRAGELPFELSGCLALSPPVNLQASARIVDRYFSEDRWDTTMVELGKRFAAHMPVAEGQAIPFQAAEMRAAIGFAFRDGLADVVERNDRHYKLKVLPSVDSGDHRKSYAEAIGLGRFVEDFTFPDWQKRSGVRSAQELWDACALKNILPRLPAYAEVVVAANDPFNPPEVLDEARAADLNRNLTIVPLGGHLGYISNDWTLMKALRIFVREIPPAPEHQQTPDEARRETRTLVKEALSREIPPPDAPQR